MAAGDARVRRRRVNRGSTSPTGIGDACMVGEALPFRDCLHKVRSIDIHDRFGRGYVPVGLVS
jgi:hypothetical protein